MRNRHMNHLKRFLADRKAASVALSTIILTAGVIAMGIAVLYWASSMGTIANRQYSQTVSTDSNALQERITYEYVSYSSSTHVLTINIINWGRANNVTIARVYVWDAQHNALGTFQLGAAPASPLLFIDNGTAIPTQSLSSGTEAQFTISFPSALPLPPYSIRIVTERGRTFDYTAW